MYQRKGRRNIITRDKFMFMTFDPETETPQEPAAEVPAAEVAEETAAEAVDEDQAE